MADSLSRLLLEVVNPRSDRLITWVPGQSDRVVRRGFDHAALLAAKLAAALEKKAEPTLTRIRKVEPQMGLQPHIRRRNLIGALAAKQIPAADILLVDDVFTTGATASEAARALKSAGAATVEVICIARALPEADGNRG